MLKCLKYLDDEIREKELEEQFYQEMADEADVDVETLHSAIGIVYFDGYFGSRPDSDYAEEGHKIGFSEAIRIVDKARQHRFSNVDFWDPNGECYCETRPAKDCDDCRGISSVDDDEKEELDCDGEERHCTCCHGCNNAYIDGKTIYDEIWKFYREIYG